MPFEFRVVGDGRIVEILATGEASADDWYAIARALPRGARVPCGLFIDLRHRATLPTAGVARSIGQWFRTDRFMAVALVARHGAQFGLARIVDLLSETEAIPVRTFTSPDRALAWLRAAVGRDESGPGEPSRPEQGGNRSAGEGSS